MPYLRIIGVIKIQETLKDLHSTYKQLVSRGSYTHYALSTIVMYLFSIIEDIVALKERDLVNKNKGDEDGIQVHYYEFLRYARNAGLFSGGLSESTLRRVVLLRNMIAHDFRGANKEFRKILKGISAPDCAKLFRNAFIAAGIDTETRLLCNDLLLKLFTTEGSQVSPEFEKWIAAENLVLKNEMQ